MVLNLDDNLIIDIDSISAVVPMSKYIVVDGTKVSVLKPTYMNAIVKAFKWNHVLHMYGKDLKKIKGE